MSDTNNKQYKYQHVVDGSQPITVNRKIEDDKSVVINTLRKAIEDITAHTGDSIAWSYTCQPPERLSLKADAANAPCYVPNKPDNQSFGLWLLFQSLSAIMDDSWARQRASSKRHDAECRSSNFEKFDDETFCLKQSVGAVRESVGALTNDLMEILKKFRDTSLSNEQRLALTQQVVVLTEKIEVLKNK